MSNAAHQRAYRKRQEQRRRELEEQVKLLEATERLVEELKGLSAALEATSAKRGETLVHIRGLLANTNSDKGKQILSLIDEVLK